MMPIIEFRQAPLIDLLDYSLRIKYITELQYLMLQLRSFFPYRQIIIIGQRLSVLYETLLTYTILTVYILISILRFFALQYITTIPTRTICAFL